MPKRGKTEYYQIPFNYKVDYNGKTRTKEKVIQIKNKSEDQFKVNYTYNYTNC